MAPRRLLALVLGLLLFSTLITALIGSPSQERLDTTSPGSGAERPVPSLPSGGKLLHKTIQVDSTKRPVVEAMVGDQLQLRVTGPKPATIDIAGLGATDDLDPAAPAQFDLLLLDRGRYPITELAGGRRIATIRVDPRARSGPDQSDPRGV